MQEYESMASRIFHNTMRLVKQRWGEKYTDIQYTEIIPDDGSEEKKKKKFKTISYFPSSHLEFTYQDPHMISSFMSSFHG